MSCYEFSLNGSSFLTYCYNVSCLVIHKYYNDMESVESLCLTFGLYYINLYWLSVISSQMVKNNKEQRYYNGIRL